MKYWGLDTAKNLPAAFNTIADQYPDRAVYAQAQFDGHFESKHQREWRDATYKEVQQRINKIADYLSGIGVTAATKVAILSTTRPEWMEADLAILSCGGISVSIYQTLPEPEIAYILWDSGAEIVFAENEEQINKLLKINSKEWDIPATEDRGASKALIKIKKIISFEEAVSHELLADYRKIIRQGTQSGKSSAATSKLDAITRNDIASFVYTSGTTGPAKGVVQTHGNHLANIRQAAESGLYNGESSIMLFLPLAHSFAKLMGYVGFLTPATLKFIAIVDTKTSRMEPMSVTRDIMEGSANIVPIVPRLLEKMKDGILRQARSGGLKGKLLTAMINSSRSVYQDGSSELKDEKGDNQSRKKTTIKDKVLYQLTGFLRTKIRLRLFGPNFMYCISGGAKLPPEVARFFDSLGIEIYEGYGLTETCVATNVNRRGAKKIGTVGPLISDDIEIRILPDGEIAFRGPNITLGYHNRKTATENSWDKDGWFYTGDLGSIDKDGYLSITGRKKEIIVGSTGKKIAPQDIEDKIKESPFVSQVVMVGEGRAYCIALVTLNYDTIKAWARDSGKDLPTAPHTDPDLKGAIMDHINKVNQNLANFEQVKKIILLPDDFTVENGLLTPTFKVKRKLVEERFKKEVEGVY